MRHRFQKGWSIHKQGAVMRAFGPSVLVRDLILEIGEARHSKKRVGTSSGFRLWTCDPTTPRS